LASSPTPDTHVRDACAFAGMENIAIPMAKTNATKTELFITLPWCYFDRQTDAKLARKSPNLRDSYHTLARAIAGRERPITFAKLAGSEGAVDAIRYVANERANN
jgi:hypothetical protein